MSLRQVRWFTNLKAVKISNTQWWSGHFRNLFLRDTYHIYTYYLDIFGLNFIEQRSQFPLTCLVLGLHKLHQVVRLSLGFVSSAKGLT